LVMFLDLLVVPFLSATVLLVVTGRLLAAMARSRHWPWWYPAPVVGLFVLTVVVAALIFELLQKLRSMRIHRETAVMQQRFPDCHVTRLSSGRWFLTDRETGREYRPASGIANGRN
jgi:hypothetical protein